MVTESYDQTDFWDGSGWLVAPWNAPELALVIAPPNLNLALAPDVFREDVEAGQYDIISEMSEDALDAAATQFTLSVYESSGLKSFKPYDDYRQEREAVRG